MTELWLAQQLRPYGIKPRTIRIGEQVAKGKLKKFVLTPLCQAFEVEKVLF